MSILIGRIDNPWIEFKVLFPTMKPGEEKALLAKKAFLYVIRTYSAFDDHQKAEMLDEIAQECPDTINDISHEEIHEQFFFLCRQLEGRHKIVSPVELEWVVKYIKIDGYRTDIEKAIYRGLLMASSHWDKMRHKFGWTISEKIRKELARTVLLTEDTVGSKRKLELAQEFGEPKDMFARDYFYKLLYDGHYGQAEKLGVNDSELVIYAIISKIKNEYLDDALNIANRFLPDRQDIIDEIKQIIAACRRR